MKKIFTLIIVAAVALMATAGSFTTTVTQTTNPTNEYSMTKSSEGSNPMNVYSAMNVPFWGTFIPVEFENFFVECIITPADMENVPAGAKVTAVSCGGHIIPGRDGEISANSLNLAAYIQDDVNPSTDPYTTGGYNAAKASYNANDLFASMTPCTLSNEDGSTAQVIHSDFDISKPFQYTGNIFKLGLDINVPDAVYFCYYTTNAETEVATTYHTPDKSIFRNIVLYYNCPYLVEIAQPNGVDLGMTFEPNKLPAFSLNYFTNDVKGKVTGAGGELTLTNGEDTFTAQVAAGEEFAFENVDYTKTYTLSLNGEVVAEGLAFEDITKDIYVEVVAGGNEPVPGDVDGDGYVTSGDITLLYNVMLNNDYTDVVNGDQDNDGNITAGDITFIYNILLGNK